MKKHESLTDSSAIRICVKKLKNRITFKTKPGYHLKPFSLETTKLLGST